MTSKEYEESIANRIALIKSQIADDGTNTFDKEKGLGEYRTVLTRTYIAYCTSFMGCTMVYTIPTCGMP